MPAVLEPLPLLPVEEVEPVLENPVEPPKEEGVP